MSVTKKWLTERFNARRATGAWLVLAAVLLGGCSDWRLMRTFPVRDAAVGDAGDVTMRGDVGDAGDVASDAMSNAAWWDAQGDEVIAPWVHKLDLTTAQAATLTDDTVSWPLPDYDYMTDWQEQDILWAPVSDPSAAFLRRVLFIETTQTTITFHTRDAALTEVFIVSREDAGPKEDVGVDQ